MMTSRVRALKQGEAIQGMAHHINGRMIKARFGVFCGDARDPAESMASVVSVITKSRIVNTIDIRIDDGANLVLDGCHPAGADIYKHAYLRWPEPFQRHDTLRVHCTRRNFRAGVNCVAGGLY